MTFFSHYCVQSFKLFNFVMQLLPLLDKQLILHLPAFLPSKLAIPVLVSLEGALYSMRF